MNAPVGRWHRRLCVPQSWGIAGTHRRDLGAWILTGTTLGGKEEPNRGFKALMKPLISIRSDSALL